MSLFALAAAGLLALGGAGFAGGGGGAQRGWNAGACGATRPSPGGTTDPRAWVIGPGNRSVGMPRHPRPHPDGWSFEFPRRGRGHVHYLTFNHGPLSGKSRIRMRYRIEAAPGVRIHPQSTGPRNLSQLAPYFQRRGDSWLAAKEHYRWYAAERHRHMPVRPGEHELVVPLRGAWGAAVRSTSANNPRAFAAAKANTQCVGFVLGGGDGVGHGVYATGPARFVLIDYRVE
jgi:hypothetical protein